MSSCRTHVSGVAAWPNRPVGRCVSSADTSLSLSLSLSCPSSASGLTARRRRVAVPLVGKITACHPRNDDCHPRGVTRDRTRSYAVTNGRQAHCDLACHARGGVAVIPRTSSRATCSGSQDVHGAQDVPGLRGGVADKKHASSLHRLSLRAACRGVGCLLSARGGVAGAQHASLVVLRDGIGTVW